HVEALNFLAPAGLGNYDAVLWSPRTFLDHLGTRIERRNPDVLSATASDELLRISRHWRHEFERLLKRDGTLVILAEPESTVCIHTMQESGHYDSLDLLKQIQRARPGHEPTL